MAKYICQKEPKDVSCGTLCMMGHGCFFGVCAVMRAVCCVYVKSITTDEYQTKYQINQPGLEQFLALA